QPRAVVDAGRDIDLQLALHLPVAFAVTHRAALLDDGACPVALPARAPDREKALLIQDLAPAVAGGAGHASATRLGAFTLAVLARLQTRNLDFRGHSENRVLKIDLEIIAEVFAALCAAAPARAASEQIAQTEELTNDVAEIGECVRIESPALYTLMAEPVIR